MGVLWCAVEVLLVLVKGPWGVFITSVGVLCSVWEVPWGSLALFRIILDLLWCPLRPLWASLGVHWGSVGLPWGSFEVFLEILWLLLEVFCVFGSLLVASGIF